MRSEFEEYYSKKYPNDQCTLIRNGNYSGWLKQQLWEQWQHQQSKVDELQAKFDQHDQWLGQRNKDVQELNDIIAKHVAAAQKLFDNWNCGDMNLFDLLDALEQAIKGGSNHE